MGAVGRNQSIRGKTSADSSSELTEMSSGRELVRRAFDRLPSLNLFRAFEAAARNSSFRLAAEELSVTPSAVSQQIRQLEDYLGIRLFRRLPQQVELTREGIMLSGFVSEALDILSNGCNRLVDPALPTVICLNASSSLASRWLVPSLKKFMTMHPQVKVTLLASNDPINFKRQDVDIAVRWGDEASWGSSVRAELMTNDFHFLVCSPDFRDEFRLREPSDLAGVTILQEVKGSPWAPWLQAAGCQQSSTSDILYFSDAALMLEAASQGQGVCLTNYVLAEKDLRSKRLVRLFGKEIDLGNEGYYLLTNAEQPEKPALSLLRNWLHDEATRTVDSFNASA